MNIIRLVLEIFALLPRDQHRRGLIVLVLICVSSLIQMAGIFSIMPFLIILADPDAITGNSTFQWAYDRFGFTSLEQFQIAFGFAVFAMLLLSTGMRSLTFYEQARFVQFQRSKLSSRIFRGYLGQKYPFFVGTKSSELMKTLLNETNLFIDRCLGSSVTIVNSSVQIIVLIGLLVAVNPGIAFLAALILGGGYVVVYWLIRPRISKVGQDRFEADAERTHIALEAFSGIKEVKLAGDELRLADRFDESTRLVDHSRLKWSAMSELPRYFIELMAFGGIVLLALVLTLSAASGSGSPSKDVFPLLVVFAFAGYRLAPALQSLYSSVSALKFMNTNVRSLQQLITSMDALPPLGAPKPAMGLSQSIELEALTYFHKIEQTGGIRGVSMKIPAGMSIGIVGHSGAGKTTLVDVLLGLLEPQSGNLIVDGRKITSENRSAWQRSIGYVPQDIFLGARSVKENIAFGTDAGEIDMDLVIQSAKSAHIHQFIINDLPDGYETEIGERGVNLSGGQRQRIGIARAMYSQPSVVVLDEATNALDSVTEAAVMNSISLLRRTKTLIMIAHRISTIQNCDRIAVMDAGKLVGFDTFENLRQDNKTFQTLVHNYHDLETGS